MGIAAPCPNTLAAVNVKLRRFGNGCAGIGALQAELALLQLGPIERCAALLAIRAGGRRIIRPLCFHMHADGIGHCVVKGVFMRAVQRFDSRRHIFNAIINSGDDIGLIGGQRGAAIAHLIINNHHIMRKRAIHCQRIVKRDLLFCAFNIAIIAN